jgi:F0F1-type ATP synthase membrane subunit b/b'
MSLETLAQVSQIVGAIVFLIAIVLIWNKWIAPGVKAYQQAKNAELAEAEARRTQMRQDVEAARAEIARADDDCREIRARIDTVIDRDKRKTIEDAQHEAERIVRNAEGELERARLAARDRLRIEFIEKALAKARADAAARVTPATDRALVESTLNDLAGGRR